MEPDTRVDLFISCHDSDELPPGFRTSELAEKTEQAVRTLALNKGEEPSVFFKGTSVGSDNSVVFDAVLQTRPGGVALFLLTSLFFHCAWCVAELRAFLKVRPDSHIKFRFVVLEQKAEQILKSSLVRELELVSELRRFFPLSVIPVTTVVKTSAVLAKRVWAAWTCDKDISSDHFPTILGRKRNVSFLRLPNYFKDEDLSTLHAVFEIRQARAATVRDAFNVAREQKVIAEHDLDKLKRAITVRNGPDQARQRRAVAGYERKWVETYGMDWSKDIKEELKKLYDKSQGDIDGFMTSATAEDGDVDAMYDRARLLQYGTDGVSADPVRAVQLYERAIAQGGHVKAMYNLALLLEDGAGEVPADPVRAVKLYKQAIKEGGHVMAMNNLALLLQNGADGVSKDPVRAVELYKQAIGKGNVMAMSNLALLLEDGAGSVSPKPGRAVELYKRAIHEGGHVKAMNNLALLLQHGAYGVRKKPDRAVELYEQAIAKGNVMAMNNLAGLLQYGAGSVPANPVRAVKLYNQAIAEGNVKAMYNLAGLLQDGANRVPPDPVRAAQLKKMAVDNGLDMAALPAVASKRSRIFQRWKPWK